VQRSKLCLDIFDDFYVLKDHTLRILIGVDEQKGGIYYFEDGSLEVDQVKAINSSTL